MKHFILLMVLISNLNVCAQTADSNSIRDSLSQTHSEWLVSGGVSVRSFEFGLLRFSYLYNLNKNFTLPLEVEYFFGNPIGSISVRYYQPLNKVTKPYLQYGLSLFLGGVESLAVIPIFNLSFGICLDNYNVEFRYLSLISSYNAEKSSENIFLAVGFYF